jgi:hypothetical protein
MKSTGPLYANPHALKDYKISIAQADAMTGLATGKKTERPQDILTPLVIVAFLHELWGGIALDPCATRDPRNVVDAANKVYGPWGPDFLGGLDIPWMDRTYCNPPYKDLRLWLGKAIDEIGKGVDSVGSPRIALLAPTRGNRTWWHRARDTTSVVVELKPLTFVGYTSAFPAPLSLLLWNRVTVAQALTAAETVGLGCTKIAAP